MSPAKQDTLVALLLAKQTESDHTPSDSIAAGLRFNAA